MTESSNTYIPGIGFISGNASKDSTSHRRRASQNLLRNSSGHNSSLNSQTMRQALQIAFEGELSDSSSSHHDESSPRRRVSDSSMPSVAGIGNVPVVSTQAPSPPSRGRRLTPAAKGLSASLHVPRQRRRASQFRPSTMETVSEKEPTYMRFF